MKEFQSQEGGRHIYNTDFKNLQDYSSAMLKIFQVAGSFVISGCGVTGTSQLTVAAGYAFINGRVVEVEQGKVSSLDNLYIEVHKRDGVSIPYADGSAHPQYCEYYGVPKNTTAPDSTYGFVKYSSTISGFPNVVSVLNTYFVTKNNGAQMIDVLTVTRQLSATKKMIAREGVQLSDSTKGLFEQGHGTGVRNGNYELAVSDGRVTLYNKDSKLFSVTGSTGKTFSIDSVESDKVKAGTVILWAGANMPDGYIACDGARVSSKDYPELFAAVGKNGSPMADYTEQGAPYYFFTLPQMNDLGAGTYNLKYIIKAK